MESINTSYDEEQVKQAIARGIESFYQSLISKIDEIKISDIIKSKNPYLYRTKAMQTSAEIIESILQAFVSSSEETIFGNCFFEPIAIAASRGMKSAVTGVDVEVNNTDSDTKYLIAVKSGTSIFNADSAKKQADNFAAAKRTLKTSGGKTHFEAIVGYAYGTKRDSGRGKAKIYEEVAGEEFWEAITGDNKFFTKIITYMGTLPEEYIEEYKNSYAKAFNRLVRDFSLEFCNDDGRINWEKLVDANSGSAARKEKETLLKNAAEIYKMIKANPIASQKSMGTDSGMGMSALKRAIEYLEGCGIISKGFNGKTKGWTINQPFTEDGEG